MSWVKLDDQWMDHPKIVRAGRDCRDMWLASITWCSKHLTDGYFPKELLPSLAVSAGVDVANCQTFATTLLDVCLWDATENGYMVHDYLDYNPTKEQAIATREARKAAGSRGGIAKASKTPSKTVANDQQNSSKSLPPPPPRPIEELREDSAPPAKPDGAEKPKRVSRRKPSTPEDRLLVDQARVLVTTFADVSKIPMTSSDWPRYMKKAKEYAAKGISPDLLTRAFWKAKNTASYPVKWIGTIEGIAISMLSDDLRRAA